MRAAFLPLAVVVLFGCARPERLTDYADPFIGTDETDFVSLWRSEAGLYPGAVAPHGMVQLSPETQTPAEFLQGYFYKKDTIRRFSLAEHFSGWPSGSAGKGLFMPFTAENHRTVRLSELQSYYSHDQESARPGSYQVDLLEAGIACAMSALVRSGMVQFSFPAEGDAGVAFGGFESFAEASPGVVEATLRAGRGEMPASERLRVHVVLEFRQPVKVLPQKTEGSWLVLLSDTGSRVLSLRLGISYTSMENAHENLEAEISHWNLATVATEAAALWEKELGRIELEGREEEKVTFYTALYHASLLPLNVTDHNGQYPGHERGGPLAPGQTHYHYFTPWDAFRTLHPLINFINPRKGQDFIESSLRHYQSFGRIPEPEVMTGVHFSALYADALAQGIPFDHQLAFEGLSDLLLEQPYFRPSLGAYDSLGYVPFPESYATTATLEFAYNDWALAQLARHLGNDSLAAGLEQRSLNYRSQLNPKDRLMHSKMPDGSWAPLSIYAEADKWNGSWFVPHDTQGLINLMGGPQAFCELLERNFAEGHYMLDNECPMNYHTLFTHAGRPDLTAKWTRHVVGKFFDNSPRGIPGNDDWGTMSSWYLWTALGLFPTTPGSGELVLTGPLFERVTIHRSASETLTITSANGGVDAPYIQAASLNGEPLDAGFVNSAALSNSTLAFTFATEADPGFGQAARPYSLTQEASKFSLSELEISQDTVASHEPFTLSATVTNYGAAGSFPLEVRLDDSVVATTFVPVKRGDTARAVVPLRLYKGGACTLAVGEKQAPITVIGTTLPADEAVQVIATRVAPLVLRNEQVWWSAEIQNISGQPIDYAPHLYVDGQPQEQLTKVRLAPGELATVSGEFAAQHLGGFHTLSLQGQQPAKFKVYAKALETLVVHYDFEEVGSKVTDLSGFENHGIVVGLVRQKPGVVGYGIAFEGAGHLAIPETPSTRLVGDQLSVVAWYKPVDQAGHASLITKGAFHMLKVQGSWQISFSAGSWGRGKALYTAQPAASAPPQPEWVGQWSHFAGVKDPTHIRVYYNGEEKNRQPHLGPVGASDATWQVGGNLEIPGRTPQGVLDEVMVFAGALSAADIQYLRSKAQHP